MQISFTTKEQSNKERQAAFLALSGAERFLRFLDLQQAISMFPSKSAPKNANNFVLKLNCEND